MMIFERVLRSGIWLRRRKKWLPLVFILSVMFAFLVTPPFTIIRSGVFLTVLSLLTALSGVLIRCITMRSSYDKFEEMIAANGIYSGIRFPLYLSNILIMLALTIYVGILWYMLAVMLIGWIIVEKIVINEENALLNKYGDTFTQWAKKTNALIPNLLNWENYEKGVSKGMALRLQSLTILLIIIGFSVIDILKNIMIDFSFRLGVLWLVLLILALLFHLLARVNRRK